MRSRDVGGHGRWRVGLVSAALAGALGYACTSSHPGGIVDSIDGSTPEGGGTVNDGGPRDTGADGSGDAGDAATTKDAAGDADSGGDSAVAACNTMDAGGPIVPETVVAGPQPTPLGGQPFQGEYWLTERDFYPESTDPPDSGSSRSGIVVQSSYFFGATSIDIVEGQGPVGATSVVLQTSSGTYTIGSATELTLRISCPPAAAVNVPFTVSGDELWLFPTRDRRDVYTAQ